MRTLTLLLCTALLALPAAGAPAPSAAPSALVSRVLARTPLIDGHNDLAWELRTRFGSNLDRVDLARPTAALPVPAGGVPLMTDIPRLRAGGVGGQFWSVWIPPAVKGPAAVQMTVEQIDLVQRLCARYPDLAMAYSAADVRRIYAAHQIACLIGVEGGHQIDNSLAVLRAYYDLGARYMTLTHVNHTDWADSSTEAPLHHGLTPFGLEVVREMNRLGMLVDLSHVSPETMRAALAASAAPVMFSHSSARALDDHPRNVPDDVLRLLAKNGGVVMINFEPDYISDAHRRWSSDHEAEKTRLSSPPYAGLYLGQPERIQQALTEWEQAHPAPPVRLGEVADHIEHVRQVAGVQHVGLGSDFDGITETPQGLAGVDGFRALLEELARRGWSEADLAALAGENVLRVLAGAETVSARLRRERAPSQAILAPHAGEAP